MVPLTKCPIACLIRCGKDGTDANASAVSANGDAEASAHSSVQGRTEEVMRCVDVPLMCVMRERNEALGDRSRLLLLK